MISQSPLAGGPKSRMDWQTKEKMKTNFFAPVRMRTDGSLFLDRRNRSLARVGKTAAVAALLTLFAVLVVMAMIGPLRADAQIVNKTDAVSCSARSAGNQ